jgi:hypothetical protein
MCGAVAGIPEDRRIVRPTTVGSVRHDGKRLGCGRCGSGLMPADEVREPHDWRESPDPQRESPGRQR